MNTKNKMLQDIKNAITMELNTREPNIQELAEQLMEYVLDNVQDLQDEHKEEIQEMILQKTRALWKN